MSERCDNPDCVECAAIFGPHIEMTIAQGENATYVRAECPDCKRKDARIAELEANHASVAKAYDERYSELIEARARIAELEAWQQFAREQMSDAALRAVDAHWAEAALATP